MGSSLAESSQLPKSSLPKLTNPPFDVANGSTLQSKSCLADGNTRILAVFILTGNGLALFSEHFHIAGSRRDSSQSEERSNRARASST
jgi:hypothetical protein